MTNEIKIPELKGNNVFANKLTIIDAAGSVRTMTASSQML